MSPAIRNFRGTGGRNVLGRGAAARQPGSGDEKPLYRSELRALSASLSSAIARTTDHETKSHLEASRDEIAKILDPKFMPPAAAATSTFGGRGGGEVHR